MSAATFVDELIEALGADNVIAGKDIGTRRVCDWSGTPGAQPIAILRPRNTAEVSQALAFCHAHGQPVVTQGGLTGLAGGANLRGGEVALSLERMNAIEEIDVVSGTGSQCRRAPCCRRYRKRPMWPVSCSRSTLARAAVAP